MGEQTVNVRRDWNDPRIATFGIADLRGLHWSEVSGGIAVRAPREFLSGYVLCDELLDGELAHSCAHGRPPHEIKVCVTQKDNPKSVYAMLLRRMEWEYAFRACPFLVENRLPTPLTSEQAADMDQWLTAHWRGDGYVTIGLERDGGTGHAGGRAQVWFSNFEIAKAFAAAFGLRSRGHQNQEKQRRAALVLARPDNPPPIGETNASDRPEEGRHTSTTRGQK